MKSVRRIYIYLVTIISLEVVIWGLIGLLRTIFSSGLLVGADTLASALSLILVGIPIFGLHWYWAQHSSEDLEEYSSVIRGIFLYTALLATLIPVAQNLLALVNRNLILATGINSYFSFVGGEQSTIDNLIAIGLNLLAAVYFYRILKTKLHDKIQESCFKETYQLYGYIWVVYSLFLTLFGIQEIIRFLFYQPGIIIGPAGKEYFINGLSMCIIGTPLWVYSWHHRQAIDQNAAEERSVIRLILLFILSLFGVITVLTMSSITAYQIVMKLLGEDVSALQLLSRVGNPVSVAVSLGIVWFYYGKWFHIEVVSRYEDGQKRALLRLHNYLLSLMGLAALIAGIAMLASFMINISTGNIIWGDVLRKNLSASIAILFTSLPLWMLVWRTSQEEAALDSQIGVEARRSIIRRSYLYIAVFGSVIGGMVSAITLVNTILFGVLDHMDSSFVPTTLNDLSLLIIFVVFLVYHLGALKQDGAFAKQSDLLEAKIKKVYVLESNSTNYFELISVEMNKSKLGISPIRLIDETGIPKNGTEEELLILPASYLFKPTVWEKVSQWAGNKFIIPNPISGFNWVGITTFDPKEVLNNINSINDNKPIKQIGVSKTWQILAYVAAVLFGFQLLLVLFGALISIVVD